MKITGRNDVGNITSNIVTRKIKELSKDNLTIVLVPIFILYMQLFLFISSVVP